eukprot:Opistho-1_new@80048
MTRLPAMATSAERSACDSMLVSAANSRTTPMLSLGCNVCCARRLFALVCCVKLSMSATQNGLSVPRVKDSADPPLFDSAMDRRTTRRPLARSADAHLKRTTRPASTASLGSALWPVSAIRNGHVSSPWTRFVVSVTLSATRMKERSVALKWPATGERKPRWTGALPRAGTTIALLDVTRKGGLGVAMPSWLCTAIATAPASSTQTRRSTSAESSGSVRVRICQSSWMSNGLLFSTRNMRTTSFSPNGCDPKFMVGGLVAMLSPVDVSRNRNGEPTTPRHTPTYDASRPPTSQRSRSSYTPHMSLYACTVMTVDENGESHPSAGETSKAAPVPPANAAARFPSSTTCPSAEGLGVSNGSDAETGRTRLLAWRSTAMAKGAGIAE